MTGQPSLGVVSQELLAQLAAEVPTARTAPPPGPAPAGNGRYTSRLRVDKWLRDKGVEFRVKDQPGARGQTIYVLKQCPFDASHGDPDSCIMQAPDGKLSAQCFHNSCQGRGWQQFKEAIGAPTAEHYDPSSQPPRNRRQPDGRLATVGATASDGKGDGTPPEGAAAEPPGRGADLPWIQGNKRQLRVVTADAHVAVLARNDPPTVFQRGGLLTRLRVRPDDGAPFLEPLAEAALRGVLARVANWMNVRDTKLGKVEEEDAPPLEVVKDLANLPAWEGIPVIEAVVECPVFSRAGDLVDSPGFHRAARLWYQPAAGLEVPPVPSRPSLADVERARHLLLQELLGDFPFQDDASRAHALAALLLSFVRALVDGPTPLHLLDASVEGTGKTLLASVIALVSTGRDVETIAEADSNEEWRKRITAVLAEGATFILLDNISRVLDAGTLAAALTARTWKDRLLGFNKTAALPNTSVWVASGNNTCLSRELIRRTLWCRLDAKVDAPWERTGFRHPNLVGWAKAHRGELVWAALTLCQAWLATGRPAGKQTLGMFESWAEIMGGILEVASVPGLLANARAFRAARTDKVSEWRAFVASWWQEYGEREVGVAELFTLATEQNLLDSVLGDKGENSQRTRLGIALGKAADRVFGDYRMERAGEDHKERQQYRLRCQQTPQRQTEDTCQWEA
jgi:hypothetical protein